MRTEHLLPALALLTLVACKKEEPADPSPTSPTSVPTERDLVMADYQENYVSGSTFVPSAGWNGNLANCEAGEVPADVLERVLQRINYYRRLVGLNDNTTWDLTCMERCQQAALMMHANNSLDHNPPNNWSCWTQAGSTGASTSNLAWVGGTASITDFMYDYGGGNTAVGHRRWLLHSAKTKFAFGSTNLVGALGVIGVAGGNQQIPDFIAYPPSGYVPRPLVFPRWSFGIPGANFATATVSMADADGNAIPLTIVSRVTGYGDNTIVWEPTLPASSSADASFTVTIGDIANAQAVSYTYTVVSAVP